MLTLLATALLAAQKSSEVESLLQEAIACHKAAAPTALLPVPVISLLARKPVPPAAAEPAKPGGLADALAQFSLFYRQAGLSADAAARLRERRRLCANDAQQLYQIAGEFLDCARLAEREALPSDPPKTKRDQEYLDEALTSLRQGIDAGYDDLPLLEKDPALEPLRHRPAFAALVKRLESKRQSSLAEPPR